MKIQIKKPVDKALEALTQQQREVLTYRYGLNGKKVQTLQEIADEYDLTRERIRQIQNTALKQMRKDSCMRHLSSAVDGIEKALHECGGIADSETLCLVCDVSSKAERGYVRLLLSVADHFAESAETNSMRKYWYRTDIGKKQAENAVNDIHKYFEDNSETVLSGKEMRSLFLDTMKKHNRPSDNMHIMRLSKKVASNNRGEWGVSNHPEITLTHMAGHIRVVLRDSQTPLHFSDIAEQIAKMRNAQCHEGSCHNELVRNDDFILVGRGLYTLRNGNNFPGTIADVISVGIRENGSMSRDQIVEYVRNFRQVKPESIDMVLYREKKFQKNREDGMYIIVGE